MMHRAADRVADDRSVRKAGMVVRATCAHRKYVIALPRNHDSLVANESEKHPAIRYSGERNTGFEIRQCRFHGGAPLRRVGLVFGVDDSAPRSVVIVPCAGINWRETSVG